MSFPGLLTWTFIRIASGQLPIPTLAPTLPVLPLVPVPTLAPTDPPTDVPTLPLGVTGAPTYVPTFATSAPTMPLCNQNGAAARPTDDITECQAADGETGLCVDAGTLPFECWAICDESKVAEDYKVRANPQGPAEEQLNTMSLMLVKRIRQGMNPTVRCKKTFNAAENSNTCTLGDRCPQATFMASFGKEESIPVNRGICVSGGYGQYTRHCQDMCDFSKDMDSFTLGTSEQKKAEIISTVNNVRTQSPFQNDGLGTTCPGHVYWPLLLGLLAVALICVGACVAYVFMRRRGMLKQFSPYNRRPAPPPMPEESDEEYQQASPQLAPMMPPVEQTAPAQLSPRPQFPPLVIQPQTETQQTVPPLSYGTPPVSEQFMQPALQQPLIEGMDRPNLFTGLSQPAVQAPAPAFQTQNYGTSFGQQVPMMTSQLPTNQQLMPPGYGYA